VSGDSAYSALRPVTRMRVETALAPIVELGRAGPAVPLVRCAEAGAKEEPGGAWRLVGVLGGDEAERAAPARSGTSHHSVFHRPVALPSSSRPSLDRTRARGSKASECTEEAEPEDAVEVEEGEGEVGMDDRAESWTTWTISCEWIEWISTVWLCRSATEYWPSMTARKHVGGQGAVMPSYVPLGAELERTKERDSVKDAPRLLKLLAHSSVPLHGSPTSLTKTPSVVEPVWLAMRNSLSATQAMAGRWRGSGPGAEGVTAEEEVEEAVEVAEGGSGSGWGDYGRGGRSRCQVCSDARALVPHGCSGREEREERGRGRRIGRARTCEMGSKGSASAASRSTIE